MKHFLFTLLIAATALAAQAQSAEELMQQALRLERSEGDFAGAIALYKQVSETGGIARQVTGQALIQMARAYESMGRAEAARTYQRVLSDFGDMPGLAAEAREGYARTREVVRDRPEPAPMSTTQVVLPEEMAGWFGTAMSTRGSYIAVRRRDPAAVIVVDVATGAQTEYPFPAEGFAQVGSVRFSPDEKLIATTVWQHDGTGLQESSKVFTLDLGTGKYTERWDNLAYYKAKLGDGACNDPEVHDWSADGSKLLLLSPWEPVCWNQPWVGEDIIVLDLESGEPTVLGDLLEHGSEESNYEFSCLSEDGRFALTDVRVTDVTDGDVLRIRRFDTQTGATTIWRELGEQTWIWGCTWSPDRILYASRGIAGTTVRSGDPASLASNDDPVVMQLAADASSIFSSKTGDTAYYEFKFNSARRDIVLAKMDDTDVIGTEPLGERTFGALAWRPGGETELAWSGPNDSIVIKDVVGGARQTVPLPGFLFGATFRWVNQDLLSVRLRAPQPSPGGLRWDAVTIDLNGQVVDRLTGVQTDSLGIENPRPIGDGLWVAWSPDRDCIVEVDAFQSTRELKCFLEGAFDHVNFIPSPWGDETLLRGYRPDSSAVQAVMSLDGTDYSELIVDSSWVGTAWNSMDWVSPSQVTHGINGWDELLLIDVSTGESRPILQDLLKEIRPSSVSISADGSRVAFKGTGRALMLPSRRSVTVVHRILEAGLRDEGAPR